MTVTPLRVLAWFFAVVAIGLPLAAVALFLLAVAGSPGSCQPNDRQITVSPGAAASFQTKWDQLNATLSAGQVSTIAFDENEATSRARQWADEHKVPVSNVYICFRAESGSASGKVDVPFFPGDVDVLIQGRLDLTGVRPKLEIDKIEAGGLPGPLTGLVKGFVNQLLDDQTKDMTLKHNYGIAFSDGQVTVSGQP